MGFSDQAFLDRSFLDRSWLRAALVGQLIYFERYQEAEEAALPLVGTAYQAWFLHARAWREWSLGRVQEARGLLTLSMQLLGLRLPVTFRFRRKRPDIFAEFLHIPYLPEPHEARRAAQSLGRRLTTWTGDPYSSGFTLSLARRVFPRIRHLLAGCAIPGLLFGYGLPGSRKPIDGLWSFILGTLRDGAALATAADQLERLQRAYSSSQSVTGTAAFYLLLDRRYVEAAHACNLYLRQKPDCPIVIALRMIAWYRMSRRAPAIREGEAVLARAGDRHGAVTLALGLFAYQESRLDTALRFIYEATPQNYLAFLLAREL